MRKEYPIKIFSDPVSEIDLSALPPVVIVTNGSKTYIKSTIDALIQVQKHIVLSGLDSEQFGEMVSCATHSRRTDIEKLLHYLIRHDRRRIALVGFWRESINDMLYYHSAMSGSMSFGEPIPEHAAYFWKHRLSESMAAFIKDAQQYDVAVCPNDTVALVLLNWCKAKNISIPSDLYITGISNMQIGRYCDPTLTTIAMDFKSIGEETLNVWDFVINHLPKPTSIKVLVPGKLIVRASTDYKEAMPQLFSGAALDFAINDSAIDLEENQFFVDPLISALMQMENCLHQRDELDQKILIGIMQGKSYETLAEELFTSVSTIRYRRNKIFKDADVDTRAAFEHLMRENIGNVASNIIE